MSLRETWKTVRADRQAGPAPTRGDLDSNEASGREWVIRMICEPFDIAPDDLVAVNADIAASTMPNLAALGDRMSLEDLIVAAVAAGFSNGLALGLVHGSRGR